MTWLWVVAIWFGCLAAWLAYVLWDDAKATLENLRKPKPTAVELDRYGNDVLGIHHQDRSES